MRQEFKLFNKDCIEVMSKMERNSIDLIVTDPPYSVITGGGKKHGDKRPSGVLKENKQLMSNIPSAIDWMPEAFRVMRDSSHAYVMTNLVNLNYFMDTANKVGFNIHNLLVWEKNTCTPSQWYMKNCEYILFLRKGKAKYINNVGSSKTVHRFDNPRNKTHPTEKPLGLFDMYVSNSSNVGDVVLDPFMGSGVCGVSCANYDRNFIGMEIEESYFNIAKDRIQSAHDVKSQQLL